ncbi:MAG: RluA family pseudouridine synthase [Nannocystis sp.]|nr:RluA family pseudouridine synthase [Nannocystis sp.]
MLAAAHTVADPSDLDQRADVVLARHSPHLSRRVLRRLALAGHLWIDGQPAPPSQRVHLGQRLELHLTPPITAAPPLVVLVATDAVLYLAKPAGLATHRLAPDQPAALADQVIERFPECRHAADDPREAGAVHRLDRATSGVIAFARDPRAWRLLRRAFAERRVDKRYAAVTALAPTAPLPADRAGSPYLRPCPALTLSDPQRADLTRCALTPRADAATALHLSAPLGHGQDRARVDVRGDGQPAATALQRLLDLPDHRALLHLDLQTGRRHQARVHLAWFGLPLLGDPTYGGPRAARLGLHAWSLDLSAAIAGEPRVIAPLPPDLLELREAG